MISKSELRLAALKKRATLKVPGFAAALARHAPALGIRAGRIFGGYHAFQSEADPAALLVRLVEGGAHVAFPRVAGKHLPLEFHRVPDDELLQPGAFGIHEPLAHWPRVVPDVVLVPLLAFDATGHRLGYGGGFYDRTLAALNARAVGIGYAAQEVASIPHEPHDRTLAAILTEQGLRTFR